MSRAGNRRIAELHFRVMVKDRISKDSARFFLLRFDENVPLYGAQKNRTSGGKEGFVVWTFHIDLRICRS